MSLSLSEQLATAILGSWARQVPDSLLAQTRLHVADAWGIACAASREPAMERLLAQLTTADAAGSYSVIGRPERVASWQAAFMNGALIHALDFDDMHDVARLHPTTVTLPAALVAAEMTRAPGRLLAAVTLGNELMCRLGQLCAPQGSGPGADWFLTQLLGYFGAATAAGIVLGLDHKALTSALGFAYMQAAGGKQTALGIGSDARGIYPAFAAAGGLQASLLARTGFTGPTGALDGAAGLLPLYMGLEPAPRALEQLLAGADWAFANTEIKPWPCCRLAHPYVAVALRLHQQLAGKQIHRIILSVNESAAKLCRPLPERRRPLTLADAKYSIPFTTALALTHGRVTLANFNQHALTDPEVLALAARVEIDVCLPDQPGHPPAEITLECVGEPPYSNANWQVPRPTDAEVRAKFNDCMTHAGLADQVDARWQFASQPGTWQPHNACDG